MAVKRQTSIEIEQTSNGNPPDKQGRGYQATTMGCTWFRIKTTNDGSVTYGEWTRVASYQSSMYRTVQNTIRLLNGELDEALKKR